LQLASDRTVDLDDYLALIQSSVAYLSHERFQKQLLTGRTLETPLAILVESYSRFVTGDYGVPGFAELALTGIHSEPQVSAEDDKLLSLMRLSLVGALSDVASLPEFISIYPLDSPLVGSLRMWLTVPHTQLQVCASVMLGNLARNDDVCRIMVLDFKVHEPLLDIIKNSKDSQSLHATAGFLKNLALYAGNKSILGEAGLIEISSRLWGSDFMTQIQYSGAALARQAVAGSCKSKVIADSEITNAHTRQMII
jgi:hypothetical protein